MDRIEPAALGVQKIRSPVWAVSGQKRSHRRLDSVVFNEMRMPTVPR
jgi:hypothetical protein